MDELHLLTLAQSWLELGQISGLMSDQQGSKSYLPLCPRAINLVDASIVIDGKELQYGTYNCTFKRRVAISSEYMNSKYIKYKKIEGEQ